MPALWKPIDSPNRHATPFGRGATTRRRRWAALAVAVASVAALLLAVGGRQAVADTSCAAATSTFDPATAVWATPASSGSSAEAAASGQIEIQDPAPGTVVIKPDVNAALRATLVGRVQTHGAVRHIEATLNGHLAEAVAAGSTYRIVLRQSSGLQLGDNELQVTGYDCSRRQPVAVKREFFLGYRSPGILAAFVHTGDADHPAAVASVRIAPDADEVDRLDATLDGTSIVVPPDDAQTRSWDLAQLGDLTPGRNVLWVRVLLNDGRAAEASRTFVVRDHADLAVATALFTPNGQPDGLVDVDQEVTLDASRSRLVPGSEQTQGQWTLVSKPVLSKAAVGRVRGFGVNSRASLLPDVPGDYKVALRLGTGRIASSDVVDVAATYAQPLIPFNTISYPDGPNAPPALMVGNGYYRSRAGDALQVWHLNRRTLEYQGYSGFPATEDGYRRLGEYLQSLPETSLVVVTYAPDERLPATGLDRFDAALRTIGGVLGSGWAFNKPNCSTGTPEQCSGGRWDKLPYAVSSAAHPAFSVIGVRGMRAGDAWRATADQSRQAGGEMTGYLTLGVATATATPNDYVVVPGGASNNVAVDTCSATTCAVKVGTTTYQPNPTVPNGVHLVILDRTTLQMEKNVTVTSLDALFTELTTFRLPQDIRRAIRGADGGYALDDQRLYFLQSVGNGRLTGTASGPVLNAIDQLGGTPETFIQSVHGSLVKRYALIGAMTNPPWHATDALESSTIMGSGTAAGGPTGDITGIIQRNRENLYTPATGDVTYNTNTTLATLMYQSQSPWPLADQTQLLAYFANNLGMSAYPDIRSAYPNRLISFESKLTQLNVVPCSSVYGNFCSDPNFTKMKSQLHAEFTGVVAVRNLIEALRAPYTDNNNAAAFDVEEVTQAVRASIPQVNGSSETTMKWLKIFSNLSSIAGIVANATPASPFAAVFGLAAEAAGLTTNLMAQAKGDPAESVQARADQLGPQMAKLQTSYLQGIYRLEKLLVTDGIKLQTVGSKVGSDPAWHWTSETTIDVSVALSGNTRGSAYTALVPLAWGGYILKPGPTETTTTDVKAYVCNQQGGKGPVTPFANALPSNQFLGAVALNNSGDPIYQVWTLANLPRWTDTTTSTKANMPNTPLTNNIYGPTSTGPSGAYQWAPAWWRSTYNPPGYTICNRVYPGYFEWSQHFSPPRITSPVP
jgi:hypothetical protein